MRTIITKVKKRDGRIVPFRISKIERAIWQAAKAAGGKNRKRAKYLAGLVVKELEERFNKTLIPEVEQIQDIVERVLLEKGHEKTYKAFTLYRDLHTRLRDVRSLVDSDELIKNYLDRSDWRVKENANMTYSLQGLNNHVASMISANFWLNQIYPREVRKAHLYGDLHIHNLSSLSPYCCGWDLKDLLIRGFGGVRGKINSRPPKHFSTALGQLVNFFYTLQGEIAGAVAVSNFDTYLAPFIRHDKLSYKEVKQAMQEFVYNMNVPTRVGFQCVSEDTEILTPQGWKNYKEIKKDNVIKTFNLKTQRIEDQKVTSVFRKEYKGVMYNLKNRIQDQLVSPGHRVVRRKFQTINKFVLEPIEDIIKLKSPFVVPIAGKNGNRELAISDEQIKLMAWIISEGTIEHPGKNYRSCYRVSIYQSKIKNRKNYQEIKDLLGHFEFNYSESETASLGDNVVRLRLNAASSKVIHKWFGSRENIHFIPENLFNLDQRQSRLFLETYLKADGFGGCKIATGDLELLNDLQRLVVNCGYGFTVLVRQPTIGKKQIYVLRIISHPETYIEKVKRVCYKGVIWCPHTKNETIIARRKGRVFITGNTPFSNVTLDLIPPESVGEEAVIIGGKPIKAQYKDFQKEIDLVNKAFAEVMLEGDAQGRVFTFPIPTYSVTRDFDWENPVLEPIFEMTRKYGVPYWANYVNSDMKPEDIRAMCCRLQINNKVLRKRGGLFAANPLTGSLGVVTINLPRIGYLAKDKKEFFQRLGRFVRIAQDSLLIKRRAVEDFTEKGLYPYCRYYLSDVKKRTGKYWSNHFNTIGILGMNEALFNFMGKSIAEPEGRAFALELMEFMREKILEYQKKANQLFNLEATPAEGSLAPEEKVLIAKSDPQLTAIGQLVDKYLQKRSDQIVRIQDTEVLKLDKDELFTFGFDKKDQKIRKYPVTALIRHKGRSMYQILTKSGRKIKVTGQHSVYTLSDEGLPIEIKVDRIRPGMLIAVPKTIKIGSFRKEFNLVEEFKNKKIADYFYLILPSNFVLELLNKQKVEDLIKKKYKTPLNQMISLWKKNCTIPLKFLYDCKISVDRKTLQASKIFYRKSKNTKPIKVLIKINEDLGFLIGSLLAEGWLGSKPRFFNTEEEFAKKFAQSCKNVFGHNSYYFIKKNREKEKRQPIFQITLSKIVGKVFRHIFDLKGVSGQKKVPSFFYRSSLASVAGLLRGFSLGDGNRYFNFKKRDYKVRFSSTSKKLIEGLNILLLKLGILTKFKTRKRINSPWSDEYVLVISGVKNLEKYYRLVLKEKFRKLKGIHSGKEIIPAVPQLLKKILQDYDLRPAKIGIWKDCFNRTIRNGRISMHFLKKIVNNLEKKIEDKRLKRIKAIISSSLFWDEIKEITRLPVPSFVYDLEVDIEGHQVNNFLGGEGLVCLHNTSYRFARIDKQRYPKIIAANEEDLGKDKVEPFYTNSTHLPVDYTTDIFEALDHQDELQCAYTGGTVVHGFLGESLPDTWSVKNLIQKISQNYNLPYFTLTPTFSICPKHGYIKGEHQFCPKCGGRKTRCEVYSRVVGYLRPVDQWNPGKQAEFYKRKEYRIADS